MFDGRRRRRLENITLRILKRRRRNLHAIGAFRSPLALQLASFCYENQMSVKISPTLRLTPRRAQSPGFPLAVTGTHLPGPRDSSPPASCSSLQIDFVGEAGQRTEKPVWGLTTVAPHWFRSLQPSPRIINQFSADRKFILLFKIVLWVFFLSLVLFSAGCVEARCKLS